MSFTFRKNARENSETEIEKIARSPGAVNIWWQSQGLQALGAPGWDKRAPKLDFAVGMLWKAQVTYLHDYFFFFWLDRILENFIIFHILPPCTHVCNIFTNSQYFSFHLQLKAEISFVLPWNSSNSHPNYSRADLLTQRGSAGSISIEHHLYSH